MPSPSLLSQFIDLFPGIILLILDILPEPSLAE
jgi:hypothetical protein